MTLDTRILILKISAAALLIVPGLIMVVGLVTPLMGLVEGFVDLAHWPVDGTDKIDTPAALLLNAILGGILVGFGILIWQVAGLIYAKDPALGRQMLLPAVIGWFLVDSMGSVLAGSPFNAALNLIFLACLLGPLVWPETAPA